MKERSIQRAALYVADELFFSGTAAEITPIRSVDHISIGTGQRGEITARIQKAFFEITKGERPAPGPWLTYVRQQEERAADQPEARASDNGNRPRTQKDEDLPAELVARARA